MATSPDPLQMPTLPKALPDETIPMLLDGAEPEADAGHAS